MPSQPHLTPTIKREPSVPSRDTTRSRQSKRNASRRDSAMSICSSSSSSPPLKTTRLASRHKKAQNGRFLSMHERNAHFARKRSRPAVHASDSETDSSINLKTNKKHPATKKLKTVPSLMSRDELANFLIHPAAVSRNNAETGPHLDLIAPYMSFQIALANLTGDAKRNAQRAAGRVQRAVEKVRRQGNVEGGEETSGSDSDDEGEEDSVETDTEDERGQDLDGEDGSSDEYEPDEETGEDEDGDGSD